VAGRLLRHRDGPRPDAGASLGLRPRADPANNVPRPIDANIAVVAAGGSAA
jgi:hypothetical protein